MSAAQMKGTPRSTPGISRTWCATLYAPAGSYTRWRVKFKAPHPKTGELVWTTRSPEQPTRTAAVALFHQIEAALDAETPVPLPDRADASVTMATLCEAYIEDCKERRLAVNTWQNRESRLRKHVVGNIGTVRVSKWRATHSRTVMSTAAQSVFSASGREDIRSDLAALRKLAHARGWLAATVDPLLGVTMPRTTSELGQHASYVPEELRPERRHVDAIAAVATDLCVNGTGRNEAVLRIANYGTLLRVAGYGGLRLAEQLGLRAVDIFPDQGWLEVNGSWVDPRAPEVEHRGPVKNWKLHRVPLPGSLMLELLPVIARSLGLQENASQQQVVNAQLRERARRTKLGASSGKTPWWAVEVDPAEEQWLFVDGSTGLPPSQEFLNTVWHKTRRELERRDPDNAWPDVIVVRNMRHHAVSFWRAELNAEWEDVAAWLGDKLQTVLNHYVRSGTDALRNAVTTLENY
ncbi:hypothetical protein KMZ32_01785 [Phycicoccus sp. MAQZ13P-2]|uniref:hypothetical protein n=1 Tax=Phycicoccus mangrovi TaxID=2840470 RepID=UPI001C003F34|nr:hypothetical protein [Phycicoccus mangrovi]MBT9254423.1 hypothetical protein [Phycicoccus mangrovi]MBT9272801.1 hypothetical protein [Phycicoccus mangrovi]